MPSAQFPRTSKVEIFFYIHPNTQVQIPTRHSHAPELTHTARCTMDVRTSTSTTAASYVSYVLTSLSQYLVLVLLVSAL